MIAKSHRWQRTAIAAAAFALLGLSGTGAWALSLGRITVQSALGEPLRAEIDVPDINAEEAASLRTVIAMPDAFVAAGLEYNPIMAAVHVSLQRRSDGRAFIRLSSERSINDPFVDMVMEASWSSGRIVRDYTMLFDPPSLRQAAAAPTLAQVPAAATPPANAPARTAAAPVPPPGPSTSPAETSRPAPAPKTTPVRSAPPSAKPAEKSAPEADKRVVIKSGDTASKIAAAVKAPSVSLDQMLVALLRSSPDAFIESNINRIRAGAVMNVPSTEQAQSVSATEATRILATQSKDFNAFRRNLASHAPTAGVAAADRKASGSIQTKVEEKKPSTTTPDKLTLSKGAIKGKASEAAIAKERSEKEAATRAAELTKNINELKKAGAAMAPAVTAPAAVAAPAPVAPAKPAVAPPAPVVAPTAPVASPAPPSPAASTPTSVASSPKVAASAPAKPASAPPAMVAEEPGFFDDLFDDPTMTAVLGGLLVALCGPVFYLIRKRKKNAAHVDSAFLESRLQPDSFFGASGGQRVDTSSEGASSGSSMVYSTSQLDAADDVDPVAEADVYMAYGRDVQAEEILKEALRVNPARLAIHTKLLEILAKRRDTVGYAALAEQALKLTGSQAPEWARICEVGLGFDPTNSLYQPGGIAEGGQAPAASLAAQPKAAGVPSGRDLDLDLDFSLDDEPASAISDVTGGKVTPMAASEQTTRMEAVSDSAASAGLDFDISGPMELNTPAPLPEISLSMDGFDMPVESSAAPSNAEFDSTGTSPIALDLPPVEPKTDPGMLEFDMGSLSLDLETPPKDADSTQSQSMDTTGEDPLETKLALAEEFISIGDEDGARALIEEVLSEATGDIRAKAQRALSNLS